MKAKRKFSTRFLGEGEARLFYKAGGLFQLGDDLLDIQEDLRDGTTTAWTMGMRSKEDFRQTLQAFLTLQDHLEKEVAVDITDPRLRKSLQNDVEAGFKFYLISAYLNPAVSGRIGTYLKEKIPFSPRNLKTILFNTYRNLVSIKQVDAKLYAAMALYGRVFDHHFLGGQYAKWEKGQGSLVKPYNISHWSPMFVATKFESMMVERLKNRTVSQVNNMIFGLGVAELGMLGYLEAYTPSDTYRLLGPATVITGMGVLKKSGSTEAVRPWAWACLGTFAATLTQFSRYAFF